VLDFSNIPLILMMSTSSPKRLISLGVRFGYIVSRVSEMFTGRFRDGRPAPGKARGLIRHGARYDTGPG
jgi:hypothetical protein